MKSKMYIAIRKAFMNIQFEPLRRDDLPAVLAIYNWYVANSTATFHTEPLTETELLEFLYIDHPKYQSFLIYANDVLAGYCFLTPHKKRQAYDRTGEVTIYLSPDFHRMGIGRKAMAFLEKVASTVGLKNILGVVTGENTSSIALFDELGYSKCAHFRNVGEKFGRVLDVVAFQKEL